MNAKDIHGLAEDLVIVAEDCESAKSQLDRAKTTLDNLIAKKVTLQDELKTRVGRNIPEKFVVIRGFVVHITESEVRVCKQELQAK